MKNVSYQKGFVEEVVSTIGVEDFLNSLKKLPDNIKNTFKSTSSDGVGVLTILNESDSNLPLFESFSSVDDIVSFLMKQDLFLIYPLLIGIQSSILKKDKIKYDIISEIGTKSIENNMSREEFYEFISEELGKVMNTKEFQVVLYNNGGEDTFKYDYYTSSTDEERDLGKTFDLDGNILRYVFEEKKSIIIDSDKYQMLVDSGNVLPLEKIIEKYGNTKMPKMWMGIPLIVAGKAIGVISIQTHDENLKGEYTQDNLELMEDIGGEFSKFIAHKRMQRETSESKDLVNKMLGIISHDIKGSLNHILGSMEPFIELIGTDIPDEDILAWKDLFNTIYNNGTNVNNLLLDMVNWVKFIDSGGKGEIKNIDFDEFINNIFDIHGIKNPKLKLTTENLINRNIIFDKILLGIVVGNFIENAIKYTKEGSVSVFLENSSILDGVKILIKDTGVGLTFNDINNLFDSDKNSEINSKGQIKGSGMGMPFVKEIVNKFGGKIIVSSEEGIGSIFEIHLPQDEGIEINNSIEDAILFEKDVVSDILSIEELSDLGKDFLKGATVLYNEDDYMNKFLYNNFFDTEYGAKMIYSDPFGSKKSAIEVFHDIFHELYNDIDLILLDNIKGLGDDIAKKYGPIAKGEGMLVLGMTNANKSDILNMNNVKNVDKVLSTLVTDDILWQIGKIVNESPLIKERRLNRK